ncbi:hypothetical protein BFP70_06780 [Thioclava sp. SK-1]|uniref:GNAT family N-acetyltransferase n=1 Tax=Thioclava sp. SK-1 TaxID=1889770 RepID=UPI0008265A88|nr:GNAT family N-acetyltransferase [Thioclava sp. SK-1]OCX65839.1 hypothetical protein BFP70_06780 [Thioclava sp. SK-1]
MTSPFATIDATWPAARMVQAGGFTIREGLGGGSRVSCASVTDDPGTTDIDAAVTAHHAMGQTACFQIRPGQDALDADLAQRGFLFYDRSSVFDIALADMPTQAPHLSGFAHWPPLAITCDLLAEGDIGPQRQAVMHRAIGPKAVVLGRHDNRAAGACFIAAHHRDDGITVAMVHGLTVSVSMRRKGLARSILIEAARWARDIGATRLMLVVRAENQPAVALYHKLQMQQVGQYHYRKEPHA